MLLAHLQPEQLRPDGLITLLLDFDLAEENAERDMTLIFGILHRFWENKHQGVFAY